MEKYDIIIDEVASYTDEVILFHSAAGKDSIVLCDMLAKKFRRVVCVFMYTVKDLEQAAIYMKWASNKYPNVEWLQMPIYSKASHIRTGFMGHWMNPKQKDVSLQDCIELARRKTGIKWVCLGMKKSDGMNRRLMLGTYKNQGIYMEGFKFFPLSEYKNQFCINYLLEKNLMMPLTYGGKGNPSSGMAVGSPAFLLWTKKNYPQDYEKIRNEYPLVDAFVFKYEKMYNEADRNNRAH